MLGLSKKIMGNRMLWATQILLALLFLFAGSTKLVMSAEDLTKDNNLSAGFLRFIGTCEVLGAIGLVAPWLSGIRRELTPIAACGLVIIMIGATIVTIMTGPAVAAVLPAAVGVLAAVVAYGRGHSAAGSRWPEHRSGSVAPFGGATSR